MKLDTRNPFADWGFEEEKYAVNISQKDYTYTKYATGATISADTVYYTYSSETGIYTENTAEEDITVTENDNYYSRSNTTTTGINKLETKGFINETVVPNAYNEVAEPITVAKYAEQHTDQASFFTNNENMLPSVLETKAYGDNKDLQREYPAGESLNYYGNEADDLKLYGEPIVYNFTSYSSDGSIEFATGKAELIKVEGDLTYVKVIENSVEPEIWVGKEFYVNETEKNENDMYPLHNIDGTTVNNVLIKLNETEIQEINEDYDSNEDSVITDNENDNNNTTVTNNTDDGLNNGNEGGSDSQSQTTDNTEAPDNIDGQ